MSKEICVTVTFLSNGLSAVDNITNYIKRFEDIINVRDISFESSWIAGKDIVRLSGTEKEVI